jgi:dTDP-4-dehydrorhamnose reductase
VASWYDFAVAIGEEAVALGLVTHAVPVQPIAATDFPTPARRPAFSVLDKSATWDAIGTVAPHWRDNLRLMLKEVAAHG